MNPTARKILLTLLIVILVTFTAGYVVWRMTRNAVENVVTRALTLEEKTIDLASVVTQVRNLNRLETASMRVMHVSTTTQTYQLVPDSLGGDELTFLAVGDVIAGVDLSLLNRDDVWRQPDGTIVMRLPQAQVLVTRVDNRESRVINRKTGLLRREDINLESRARQRAEAEIRNESMRKGILNMATQNAEAKLADFLHTLGFQKVSFVTRGPAPPPPL
ncbi:MAG TPA: DUF4230 domain-containing protein [Thermoanaerobaculia bacterium]|nr:DUF4230 domain-containing protein [Thermoanaerobaculia bacterium]